MLLVPHGVEEDVTPSNAAKGSRTRCQKAIACWVVLAPGLSATARKVAQSAAAPHRARCHGADTGAPTKNSAIWRCLLDRGDECKARRPQLLNFSQNG